MKIAYLIMAHNEPEVFKELVSALDYPGNDIYVHIDAKSDIFQFCGIQTKYSKIIFTDRVDNRWGSQRTIEAEIILFETARWGRLSENSRRGVKLSSEPSSLKKCAPSELTHCVKSNVLRSTIKPQSSSRTAWGGAI